MKTIDEEEIGKVEKLTPSDQQINEIRESFFGLATDLKKDLTKAMEYSAKDNTVEPIVNLFEGVLGVIASLCAVANLMDNESRIKLYNCEGCLRRKECKNFLEYCERKEAKKQGTLFEIPVLYSDKKH